MPTQDNKVLDAEAGIEVETQLAGPQGLSAYEVYVKDGGELTEEQWLASLKGETGAPGQPGRDGVDGTDGTDGKSLEFNWNNTQLGIRQEGQSEYQYQDLKGDTGASGRDGTNGVDGFSPTASVSKSGSTATITITDKNGTTTAQVSDGEDAPIYTAGENITIENNVISALPGVTFQVVDGKLVIDYE